MNNQEVIFEVSHETHQHSCQEYNFQEHNCQQDQHVCNHSCKISDTKIPVNSNERNKDNEDIQDNEDIALSTKFYRRNKVSREKVHKCPHCDYETTGPKQTLINHIKAKHTAEKDKPYYCSCCNKGFAQAANYEKHMKRFHDTEVKVTKTREERRPFVYAIKIGDKEPTSKHTRARYEYYLNNKHIKASKLGKIKYSEEKMLCQKDLHYDKKNNYISFTVYTKDEFDNYIKLLKKLNNTKKPKKVKMMQ